LILIGGAQRSGTTLLQTLLANALGTPVLPEAHILCDLMESYKRAKDAPRKTQYFYAGGDELLAFFRACAERHIGDLASRLDGTDSLVLKDPNFVRFDEEAASLLPNAVRIVCLRDPRDIAASFLRIGQRETQGEAGKYRRRDIHFIGKKIVESYAGLADRRSPNLHCVRYEELVAAPKDTLRELANGAGLKLSLDRIDNPVWLESGARHDPAWVSHLEEGAPSTESVGSYRKAMSAREAALVEQICTDVMDFAGYAPASPPPRGSVEGPARFARGIVNRLKRGYWSYRARFP
jgi:hypothetical protein